MVIEETNVDLLNHLVEKLRYHQISQRHTRQHRQADVRARHQGGHGCVSRSCKRRWRMARSSRRSRRSRSTRAPHSSDRPAALTEILSLLASAKTDVTGTALTTDFTGSILAPNFDLLNTIRAMQARYSLAAGSYDAALGFANEVPATATSVITFAGADLNPMRDLFHGSKYFGADFDLQDERRGGRHSRGQVHEERFRRRFAALGGASMFETNIYLTETSPFRCSHRTSCSLIRAEALARLNRLPEAIEQINIVRGTRGTGPQRPRLTCRPRRQCSTRSSRSGRTRCSRSGFTGRMSAGSGRLRWPRCRACHIHLRFAQPTRTLHLTR